MDIRWVYMTAPSLEEAQRIGRALVEEGLAACVNALPGMRSIYVWEGKVEEASEAVLVAKTTAAQVEELFAAVKRLHPYECPCMLSFKVQEGFAPFLDWIRESVRKRA
ncbi:MAG: divalent-cation tolerance protein CutA [Desulfobacterales bacterium]